MDAKELRIGNKVLAKTSTEPGNEWDVTTLDVIEIAMIESGALEAKPIPLTEDWLENLGFELGANGHKSIPAWKHPNLDIVLMRYDGIGIIGWTFQPPLDYVHQLQNLFLALTGKELEISA